MYKSNLMIIFLTTYITTTFAYNFQSCTSDKDCQIQDLYCIKQKCNCKSPYRFDGGMRTEAGNNQTKAECVLVLNANCTNNDDCMNVDNSACSENKCSCIEGFKPENIGNRCGRVSGPNEYCENVENCITVMGGSAECTEQKCQCKPGYHTNSKNVCILNKSLDEKCADDDCYSSINGKNVLNCNNSVCVCTHGKNAEGQCIDGRCNKMEDCQKIFLNETRECMNNTCVCESGSVEENGKCVVQMKATSCMKNEDCYTVGNNNSTIECKNGTCQCKQGFTEKAGKCTSGAATITISFILVFIFLCISSKTSLI